MTARRPATRASLAIGALLVAGLVGACGPTVSGSPDPGDSVVDESPTATNPAGATATPLSTAGTSATPVAGSPGTTQPPATETPGATASTGSGSGNASVDLCAKLPAADVEAVIGASGVAAHPDQGDASAGYCSYRVGDRIVLNTTFIATGAAQALQAFAGASEAVTGIADGATWVPSQAFLYIRKGDSLMGIHVVPGPIAPDGLKAASILLGQTAAGRL